MDEDALRRIVAQVVREEVQTIREEVQAIRQDLGAVHAEIKASELRTTEGGRLQFRQLAELYRNTLEKVEHLGKHLGDRIDVTRGSIEALRSSLERQDFRADELGRRITAIETRPQL